MLEATALPDTPKSGLSRATFLRDSVITSIGLGALAGCSGASSSALLPSKSLLTNDSLSQGRRTLSATPPLYTKTFTVDGYTFTLSRYTSSLTLTTGSSGTGQIIMTCVVDTNANTVTTSPLGYQPATVNLGAATGSAPIQVFNSTITQVSASNVNFSSQPAGGSGVLTYVTGAANTSGTFRGNNSTSAVLYTNKNGGGTGCTPKNPCGMASGGKSPIPAIGFGMTGVIGGVCAILEIGVAITPLGMAIATILIAGSVLGMFYDLSEFNNTNQDW